MENMQIIVGGAAGEGSKKAGLFVAKLLNAYGFRVFIHEDYESVIKGGHNFSYISATQGEHNAVRDKVNFVLALNRDAVAKHAEKIYPGGVLLYDKGTAGDVSEFVRDGVTFVELPLADFVAEAGGIPLMKNTALVASFAKTIGIDQETLKEVLLKEIRRESEKNLEVANIAYEKMEQKSTVVRTGNKPLSLLSGNEAVAVGAIDAGLECYFAYPMTPATTILGFLSATEGVRVFQPENEIAVINAAVGSAYAGRRTMVGTSGGGFALMAEGISLAAQAETPVVIALSQRMGPASGVPTYQAQGDLLFALYSGHGDLERFVVAPGDVDEAYYWGGETMNIAWQYQIPAIILLDKELSENRYGFTARESKEVTKRTAFLSDKKEDYDRYEGDAISPMKFPGEEGVVVKGTSYEHDKKGVATENAGEITAMQNKRISKHKLMAEEISKMEGVKVYGEGNKVVLFWGSTKGAVIEATKALDIKLVQIIICQPFPTKQLAEALVGVEKIICVENNASGQMAKVVKGEGVKVDVEILQYDGRPFSVEQLHERIKNSL